MENPQVGLRRRRRAIPDEVDNLDFLQNAPRGDHDDEDDDNNNDNHNNDPLDIRNIRPIPDLARDFHELHGARRLIPPPQLLRTARPPQARRERRPPSDTPTEHSYAAARWRVSQLYCLLSMILAILAIIVTPSKTVSTDVELAQPLTSLAATTSSQWSTMEQVAKAAAMGLVAKKGEQPDLDNNDLIQSIQQWWNAQQQQLQQKQYSNPSNQEPNNPNVRNFIPSPFWWWRHNRQKDGPTKVADEVVASFAIDGVWATLSEMFWSWIDPSIVFYRSSTTPTDIIDKILTSTPRLLAIANFMLSITYLFHSAIASWFLGDYALVPSSIPGMALNAGTAGSVEWSSPTRERMGGFLVFKLLLISAVVAPDTLDLLILLTWYTTLSCLRSLDHLAHATTTHLSALGQSPRTGVVQLLILVLVGNMLAAASCVALFHAAGWGMVLLLTCDCALLAADVLSHILKHFTCVLEDIHSQTIQSLEARQIQLHNEINSNNGSIANGAGPPSLPSPLETPGAEERLESTLEYANISSTESDIGESPLSSPDEILQESRRLDQRMEVLDLAHARRLGIMENAMFALDLLCHALTVAHFCHIWCLHGVQFTLIDGVLALHLHAAFSSACKKIAQRRNIHSIARDLQGLFPNASDQELRKASLAGDVCCICLGTMSTGGHVKKVPCGHLYHTHCLREVVERAQSMQAAKCPLCRSCLLDGQRQGNNHSNVVGGATANVGPPAQARAQVEQTPRPVGGGDHALFRFSTEGILPVWIPVPAFSFEVVRRPSAPIGPAPPPVPIIGQQAASLNVNVAQEENSDSPGQDPQALLQGLNDSAAPLQRAVEMQEQPHQEEPPPSFLRRFLMLAGAIPMSPEEEARALAQLVDMFPQYERRHLLRELRERGSPEAVAEAILVGVFSSGVPRGE